MQKSIIVASHLHLNSNGLVILCFLLISILLFSSFVPFSSAQSQSSTNVISCKPVPESSLISRPITENTTTKALIDPLTNITQQVRKSLTEYGKSSTDQSRQILQKLADERKKMFVDLIRKNPDAAIALIQAPEELSQLNKISTNCFEKFVTVTGKLRVQVANLKDNTALYRYDLITNDNKSIINIHPVSGLKVPPISGTEVRISGFQIDNDILFNGSSSVKNSTGISGIEVLRESSILAIHGGRPTLVLLVNFSDTPAKPTITTSQLLNTTFNHPSKSVNVFYRANSYNDVSLSGDVSGRYDLNIKACAPKDADLNATIVAADPQIDFKSYAHLVLVAPYGACFRGLGDIGQFRTIQTGDSPGPIPMTLSRVDSEDFSVNSVITHELGHNFGANHASALDCGANTVTFNFPVYYDCDYSEYGDPYDVMGPDWNLGHFNAPHMDNFGWFSSSNIVTVNPNDCETPCRFTLEPIETATNNLKALKIPRGNGDFLYVEYRQPIGSDQIFESLGSDVFSGATLHISGDRGASYPYLVDSSPDGRNDGESLHSVLFSGRNFSEPSLGVETISANSSTLTVDVYKPSPIEFTIPPPKFIKKWAVHGTLPNGIAVDFPSRDVYVVARNNQNFSEIQKFSNNGDFITAWSPFGPGPGPFKYLTDIAIDDSNNLYATDYHNSRVHKYLLTSPCPPTLTQIVPGVCFVTTFGSAGRNDGQFRYPEGVAVDNSGYVYISESGNNRVQKFLLTSPCPSGSTQVASGICFITKWGSGCFVVRSLPADARNGCNGKFNSPGGIATDLSGNVFVVDRGNSRIQKFTSNGDFITKWGFLGNDTSKNGIGQFRDPRNLEFDLYGNVYVADNDNYRIQKFTNTGLPIEMWGSRCEISSGDGCNLSSPGANMPGDGQFSGPRGIAIIFPDFPSEPTNMYVVDGSDELLDTSRLPDNARIQVFSPCSLPTCP